MAIDHKLYFLYAYYSEFNKECLLSYWFSKVFEDVLLYEIHNPDSSTITLIKNNMDRWGPKPSWVCYVTRYESYNDFMESHNLTEEDITLAQLKYA